jgi:DNA-binding CsgD family transcriptional regulator
MRGGSPAQVDGDRLDRDAAAAVRAVLALADDDLEGARQAAEGIGTANPLSPAVAAVAAVASPDHDPERCAALAAGLVGRAAARAHAALRDVTADAADAGAAGDQVRDAVAHLTAAPWFAAVLTRTTAPALVEAGAGEAVRDPLRSAVATFDSLGLAAPADACRALLRKAGVPVPRRAEFRSGVPERLASYGVTAREMDVLRLVAEGLTSREIGERLYLSPRTVEKHVERLLVKTGSGNRAALAALVGVPEVT